VEHVLFIQETKPEKKAEYIASHKECWPELLRAVKASGIERELIWMNANTIIIYIMTEDFEKSIASLVKKPVYKKWNEKMSQLLAETQDFEGGNVIQLEKVFDLERQLQES